MANLDCRRNGNWKDAEGRLTEEWILEGCRGEQKPKIKTTTLSDMTSSTICLLSSEITLMLCYVVILCTVNTLCHSSDMIPHYSSYTHPAECVGGWRLPGLTD